MGSRRIRARGALARCSPILPRRSAVSSKFPSSCQNRLGAIAVSSASRSSARSASAACSSGSSSRGTRNERRQCACPSWRQDRISSVVTAFCFARSLRRVAHSAACSCPPPTRVMRRSASPTAYDEILAGFHFRQQRGQVGLGLADLYLTCHVFRLSALASLRSVRCDCSMRLASPTCRVRRRSWSSTVCLIGGGCARMQVPKRPAADRRPGACAGKLTATGKGREA